MFFTPLLQEAAQQQAGDGQWNYITNAAAVNFVSGTTIATPSFAVSVGQLVVVFFGFETTDSTVSVSDSAGNTYTALTKYSSAGLQWIQMFYTVATFASASNVVTATNSIAANYRNLVATVYQPPIDKVLLDTSSGGSVAASVNISGIAVDPITSRSSLLVFGTKSFDSPTSMYPNSIGWQSGGYVSSLLAMYQNASDGAVRLAGADKTGGGFTPDWVYAWAVFAINISRPSSDITTTGWTGDPNNTTLYANVDEVTPVDFDLVVSPRLTASPGPVVFGVSPTQPAGTLTVRVRARYDNASGQIRAVLQDSSGVTVGTSSWQVLTATPTTYNLNVTTTGTAARARLEVQP